MSSADAPTDAPVAAPETHDRKFEDIDGDQAPVEMSSLCMNCHEQGTTRLLLTRIPHFKEIVIMAFECPHCYYRSSEVQSAREIQEKGITITCRVETTKDLNRQIVKAESATFRIPVLDLEIPPTSDRGSLNTIEGVIEEIATNLEGDQEARKEVDPESYAKIEEFIKRLRALQEVKEPFEVILDDPAGNSYMENFHYPADDPQLTIRHYTRTEDQDHALGLYAPQATDIGTKVQDEVYQFPSICSSCQEPTICRMKMVDIPFFKEVIIMATHCESCGFKTNEVKSGGAISPKGRRIILKLTDPEDMARDVLKSESCKISIPEIDLEVTAGTLGSRFTTLEALLLQIHDEILNNPFMAGDSAASARGSIDSFLANLKDVIELKRPATIILEDPLGLSYLQNVYAPDDDPNMTIEEFDRTWEDNEMWGLNDMKTTDYEESGEKKEEGDKKEEEEGEKKN